MSSILVFKGIWGVKEDNQMLSIHFIICKVRPQPILSPLNQGWFVPRLVEISPMVAVKNFETRWVYRWTDDRQNVSSCEIQGRWKRILHSYLALKCYIKDLKSVHTWVVFHIHYILWAGQKYASHNWSPVEELHSHWNGEQIISIIKFKII